jgi:hypothetical protein
MPTPRRRPGKSDDPPTPEETPTPEAPEVTDPPSEDAPPETTTGTPETTPPHEGSPSRQRPGGTAYRLFYEQVIETNDGDVEALVPLANDDREDGCWVAPNPQQVVQKWKEAFRAARDEEPNVMGMVFVIMPERNYSRFRPVVSIELEPV